MEGPLLLRPSAGRDCARKYSHFLRQNVEANATYENKLTSFPAVRALELSEGSLHHPSFGAPLFPPFNGKDSRGKQARSEFWSKGFTERSR
jgi:hypothetical protein